MHFCVLHLKASPRIRFNKEGTLLAVSANDNRIKILATIDGLHLMRTFEGHSLIASRIGVASEILIKVSILFPNLFVFRYRNVLMGYCYSST